LKPAKLTVTRKATGPIAWRKEWWLGVLLLAAILVAYQPVWHAGFVWDDDAHVTSPALRSWQGLARIWLELGATQQYYPLVHSLFWVEHRIWGDLPLGYHLINVLLHFFAALLLAVLLRQLEIPGAWLAAFLFALHPVEVESVAWISELKNTLSAVCYLGSALAYLRFDRERKWNWYLVSLGLFAAGLLAKTVIATLPPALLLVFWWRRRKLRWKEDLAPLGPFFIAGLGMGWLTAWVERTLVIGGDAGSHLSFMERCLVPERAICFYLGKLVWPHPLLFIYPRWELSRAEWRQFLFPAAVLLLGAGLWSWRRRLGYGPLVALLFFAGTLFPALGFFDVYPFRYSFVADHFQYLASIGPLTLAAAGMERGLHWLTNAGLVPRAILYAGLLTALGALTWRQCGMYADAETLWRATIAVNPNCWMAHDNLGLFYLQHGQAEEAIAQYQQTLEIKPDCTEARNNLGLAYFKRGETEEAMAQYEKVLESKPSDAAARYNLGLALFQQGKLEAAIAQYREALKSQPDSAETRIALGFALSKNGEPEEAIVQYRKALEIAPENAGALSNLGNALLVKGDLDGAMACFKKATAINQLPVEAWYNLGNGFLQRGQLDQAIASYQQAIKINPRYADTCANLGVAYFKEGQTKQAMDAWQQALEINPGQLYVQNNLAWLLATTPDASLRNGTKAVALAAQANEMSGGGNPTVLHTLAAAYAEAGSYKLAASTARRSRELALEQKNDTLAATLQNEIKLYEADSPVRGAGR
jgi:tetratricopeptide (TPR) repeat protein